MKYQIVLRNSMGCVVDRSQVYEIDTAETYNKSGDPQDHLLYDLVSRKWILAVGDTIQIEEIQ